MSSGKKRGGGASSSSGTRVPHTLLPPLPVPPGQDLPVPSQPSISTPVIPLPPPPPTARVAVPGQPRNPPSGRDRSAPTTDSKVDFGGGSSSSPQIPPSRDCGATFFCYTCSRAFRKKADLHRHISRMHVPSEHRRYICKICGQGFIENGELQRHIRMVHVEEKPFACTMPGCPARFKTVSNRNAHVRKHERAVSEGVEAGTRRNPQTWSKQTSS